MAELGSGVVRSGGDSTMLATLRRSHHWPSLCRPSLLRLLPALLLGIACPGRTPARAAPANSFIQELTLAVDRSADPRKVRPNDLRELEGVLTRRLPILAKKGGTVRVESPDMIVMRAPADRVSKAQLNQLLRPGLLELRELTGIRGPRDTTARYQLETLETPTETIQRVRDTQTMKAVTLAEYSARCPVLAATADLEPDKARRFGGGAGLVVRVQFNPKTSRRLSDFASRPGRIVMVLLDGALMGVNYTAGKVRTLTRTTGEPKVAGEETFGLGQLDLGGGFATEEEAEYLATVLNSGALPLPLVLRSKRITAD